MGGFQLLSSALVAKLRLWGKGRIRGPDVHDFNRAIQAGQLPEDMVLGHAISLSTGDVDYVNLGGLVANLGCKALEGVSNYYMYQRPSTRSIARHHLKEFATHPGIMSYVTAVMLGCRPVGARSTGPQRPACFNETGVKD